MFTSKAMVLFFIVSFVNKEKQNKSSANILRFLVEIIITLIVYNSNLVFRFIIQEVQRRWKRR